MSNAIVDAYASALKDDASLAVKVHVIDNVGKIPAALLMSTADVVCYVDEIVALNAAELHKPAIILLAFELRGNNTASYVSHLLAASPLTSIVVVGDGLNDEQVLKCLLAGAKGYQDSGKLESYLDRMLRAIAAGEAWVGRKMVGRLLDEIHQLKLI